MVMVCSLSSAAKALPRSRATGVRGNDDAGARSSDAHETSGAHWMSSQYYPLLITTPCDRSRLPDSMVALEPLRTRLVQPSVNKGKKNSRSVRPRL
jgi:hypothetical protein